MEKYEKTPQELEALRQKELQEFADAAKRAEATNANAIEGTSMDVSAEVEPTRQPKYGEQHGNKKYSMFKNESSADNMPRTTDTTI